LIGDLDNNFISGGRIGELTSWFQGLSDFAQPLNHLIEDKSGLVARPQFFVGRLDRTLPLENERGWSFIRMNAWALARRFTITMLPLFFICAAAVIEVPPSSPCNVKSMTGSI